MSHGSIIEAGRIRSIVIRSVISYGSFKKLILSLSTGRAVDWSMAGVFAKESGNLQDGKVIFDAPSLISDRVVVMEKETGCHELSRVLRFFAPSHSCKTSEHEPAKWDESDFVQSEVKLRQKRKHSTVENSTGFSGVTFASPSRFTHGSFGAQAVSVFSSHCSNNSPPPLLP